MTDMKIHIDGKEADASASELAEFLNEYLGIEVSPTAAEVSCAALGWADVAQAQESATEIVAAAVRQHGHVCEKPESAEPDHQNTTPDEKAWIIRCENGSYRVKFMGGRGAEVEPVDD